MQSINLQISFEDNRSTFNWDYESQVRKIGDRIRSKRYKGRLTHRDRHSVQVDRRLKMNPTILTLLTLAAFRAADAATCNFVPPMTSSKTNDASFGFIMIPGAQLAGDAYLPLALKIQSIFPGSLWLGLTDFFLADFPNPIEISSAISACLDQARYVYNSFSF